MWTVNTRPARCVASKRRRTRPSSVAPLYRPGSSAVEDVVAAPRPDPRSADSSDDRDVIAVVLADGTVRRVSEAPAGERHRPRWQSGRLCGPGWVLWWELRSWEDGASC